MAHPFDNPYSEEQPTAPPVWRSRLWAVNQEQGYLPSWEEFRDWALSRPDARGMSLDYLHDMYQTKRAYLREHWHERVITERVGSDDLTNMA